MALKRKILTVTLALFLIPSITLAFVFENKDVAPTSKPKISAPKTSTQKSTSVDYSRFKNPHLARFLDKKNVIIYYGISSNGVNFRGLGWGLNHPELGWHRFTSRYIRPYMKHGIRRFAIWNPFGRGPKTNGMHNDQFTVAKRYPAQKKSVETFVDAWKPITRQGIEVIAYVGSPRLTPSMKHMENVPKSPARDKMLAFAMKNMQPFIDAGMSIGLDAASPAKRGSLTHELAETLRGMGVTVYVEARQQSYGKHPDGRFIDGRHFWDYPVISTDSHWRRSDPDIFADAKRVRSASNSEIKGEKLIIAVRKPKDYLKKNPEVKRWEAGRARDLIRQGYTPIIGGGYSMDSAVWDELESFF